PAATEISGHCRFDFGFRRLRTLIQECLGLHDHSAGAISALCSLLFNERMLYGVRVLRISEAFQRHDLRIAHIADRRNAGARRLAVDDDSACAALSKATAEFGSVER